MRQSLALMLSGVMLVLGCTMAPAPSPTPGQPTPTPSPAVRELDGAALTASGGCGDTFIWAATADGSLGIRMQWDSAATEAWTLDGFSETARLPREPVEVALVAGRHVERLYCTDILEPGVEETSSAVARAGTVELTVRPDAGGFEPASHADLTLRDLVFNVVFGDEEETWHLDELVIENVSVGWFAG